MINLLFIHGLHGSPDNMLVKRLRKHLGNEYNIIAPQIPVDCHAALRVIGEICSSTRIDIVVGVSLGGFLALTCTGMPRLVINPCLSPSAEIERLGATAAEAGSYLGNEQAMQLNAASPEDERRTVGIFGSHDELFGYGPVFAGRYHFAKTYFVIDGHTLSKENVLEVVIPVIKELAEKTGVRHS